MEDILMLFCHFYYVFLLLPQWAKAYSISLLSLWITGSPRALWSIWWQEDWYGPAILFFLCLVQQSLPKAWKPHFLHLQCGPVADHSDVDSISCSALYCHLSPATARTGMTLLFFFKGWWNDMTVPSLLSEYYLSTTVLYFVHLFFSFLCTYF